MGAGAVADLRATDPKRLGAYEVLGRLGRGGQGVVYLGRPLEGDTTETVAIKLLHSEVADDTEARARFIREAEVVKRVAAFCTAKVLEADVAGARPYIVTEYVPGPSLREMVTGRGPLIGGALERLAVGTATALAAIHRAGVMHRDFKPHNVLMGPDGPRVIDFGVARVLDNATMTSKALGTPAFMAPEQLQGKAVTPASDIFAWAGTIMYAATGRTPFGQDLIPAVMNRILNHEPDLENVPESLRGLLSDCLNKDPLRRPTASQALYRLLGREAGAAPGALLATEDTAVVPETAGEPAPAELDGTVPVASRAEPGRRRRRRGLITGLIGGAVAVAAVVLAMIVLWPADATSREGAPGDKGSSTVQPPAPTPASSTKPAPAKTQKRTTQRPVQPAPRKSVPQEPTKEPEPDPSPGVTLGDCDIAC